MSKPCAIHPHRRGRKQETGASSAQMLTEPLIGPQLTMPRRASRPRLGPEDPHLRRSDAQSDAAALLRRKQAAAEEEHAAARQASSLARLEAKIAAMQGRQGTTAGLSKEGTIIVSPPPAEEAPLRSEKKRRKDEKRLRKEEKRVRKEKKKRHRSTVPEPPQ